MEFSEWMKKHKFLEEILKSYGTMEKPVPKNYQHQDVLDLCDKESTFNTSLAADQKITCKKLLRNLFSSNGLDMNKFINFCSNLYVWLYFELEKSSISNEIIKKIFELPNSTEDGRLKYYICPYVKFNDEINSPENLMKLSIFNDNTPTFQSMLKSSKMSEDCQLRKYVYDCADIYNKTNKSYSSLQECNSSPRENTCRIINDFYSMYTTYIFKKPGITDDFPELSSNTPLKNMDECPVEEPESNLITVETQPDTPTTGGASTALSAMVGIPPFLILMYKFTPIRNLFRFGNKNNTIITSNFDKNMENELFHAIKEDSNIKDIQPKYNIGYEPK